MKKELFFCKSDCDNLDLDLYYCGYEECCNGFSAGPYRKEHFLIHYVLSGEGYLESQGNVYKLYEGDGFVIFPNQIVKYWSDKIPAWSFCWFAYGGKIASHLADSLNLSIDYPVFKSEKSERIKVESEIVEMLHLEDSKLSLIQRLSHLYTIFTVMEQNRQTESENMSINRRDSYIQKALTFIKYNFDKKISVGDVVKHVNLERSYFSKIFKKGVGVSPQTYIINYRMKKAAELLIASNLSVAQISECVGIENEYYLWRIFKRYTGLSPTMYRSENKFE